LAPASALKAGPVIASRAQAPIAFAAILLLWDRKLEKFLITLISTSHLHILPTFYACAAAYGSKTNETILGLGDSRDGADVIDESSPEPQRKAIDQNAWPIHANGSSVDSFHGIETPE
jgi:hypothetical protein